MAHHRDRWLNAEALFNYGFEIWHLVEILESHRLFELTRADTALLFTNLGENFWMISKVLESIDQAAAHGILTSEQEGKHDHGHLTIAELLAALISGILKKGDPLVEHALRFLAL